MKPLFVRRLNLAFAIFLAPVLACTASITSSTPGTTPVGSGGSAGPAGSGGSGTPVQPGSGGAGVVTGTGGGPVQPGTGGAPVVVTPPVVVPPITAVLVPESAGPLPLIRLSHREYNNTIRDLLGDTSNPATDWAPDNATTQGFEAPTDVAKLVITDVESESLAIVDRAITANRLTPLIPCTNPAAGTAETTCARSFITTFGRRAFRRPVTAVEQTDLMTVFTTARGVDVAADFTNAIGWVVKAMLQSPNFLYHWEMGPTKPVKDGTLVSLTPHQIASRLSYFLWKSMPDEALLTAADMGQLTTPEQVAAQAVRLLTDKTKAISALYDFHRQWLLYLNLEQLAKNTTLYPFVTEAFKAALEPEIQNFISSVFLGGDGSLKTLFTAPYAYVNQSTAIVYGVSVTGAAMQKVDLNPAQRAGILTQAAFQSTMGAPGGSFPVRRGLAVWEQILCGPRIAPIANVPEPPKVDGQTIVTTRQQFAVHASPACVGCHKNFDSLGFAFENYDGVGQYRTMENGQMVDASGTGMTPGGATYSFKNAIELANFLATSDEVKTCLGRQWFRYFLGRMEVEADKGSIQLAVKQAADKDPNFSVTEMLFSAVRSKSFRMRLPGAGEPL